MSTEPAPFRWRSVAVAAFVPSILFSLGMYALVPVVPVLAARAGAGLGGAALIASMTVVGQLLGDIPSGGIVARIGERTAMIAAAGLAIVGALAAYLAPHPVVLAFGMLLIGVAAAAFGLARHAFLTTAVPLRMRARALSTLGGSARLGAVLGPFAGAGLIVVTGRVESVLFLLVGACLVVGVLLLALPDPADAADPGADEVRAEAAGLVRTLAAFRRVLLTVGVGAALLSGLRQARQVVLPVWAASLGLDETTTSVVIGVAGAVDFSLFFLGGWIMDRFGRMWTILPCAFGLALGFVALAFTHDLPESVAWFAGIAVGLSLANGLGSGVLMTLGADLADRRNPAPFLGAWRFTTDLGGATLPLVVTAVTALAALPVAVGVLGVIGLGCGALLAGVVPRFVANRPGQGPLAR